LNRLDFLRARRSPCEGGATFFVKKKGGCFCHEKGGKDFFEDSNMFRIDISRETD
jgi:hypothetical protein